MSNTKARQEDLVPDETEQEFYRETLAPVDVGIDATVQANPAAFDMQQPCELHILKSLRRIIRALDLASRKVKRGYGLIVRQLVSLSTIAEEGPLSSIALSCTAQTEHHRRHLGSSSENGANQEGTERHRSKAGHFEFYGPRERGGLWCPFSTTRQPDQRSEELSGYGAKLPSLSRGPEWLISCKCSLSLSRRFSLSEKSTTH